MRDESKLAPFKFLGLTFGKASDNINYPTTYPFSEKEGKMYVNCETGQWNSFTSNKQGNIITFLREYYELCLNHTTEDDLQAVCEDRKLPMQAIKGEIAYNPLTNKFLIPSRNIEGFVVNLTSWSPMYRKPMRVPGIGVSLIGLEKLKDSDKTIYMCEGEWDVIALTWFLKAIGNDSAVIGVPGVTTFKDIWIGYFQRKNVNVIYDNDKAGFDGQQKVASKIRTVARKLQFLIYPELTKTKYDIRDMIIEHGAYPDYTPASMKKLLIRVESMMFPQTQYERDSSTGNAGSSTSAAATFAKKDSDVKVPKREELEMMFKRHLKMKHTKDIAIMFATCFANKYKGDPVWLFLVAPPGGSKTELLMTLSKSPYIETTSTLTPAALVPGYRAQEGKVDPSLLKKVDGRMLVVKDMTTMLSMQPIMRDEVFGLLRDAYDGYVEKWFATHKKSYTTHFGMIAGVTPAIDAYNSVMTTMGARFIHWRIGVDDTIQDHRDKIKKAMSNVNEEEKMRNELQEVSYRFLEKPIPEEMPKCSEEVEYKIISMAMFTSAIRASIIKDKYSQEQMAPIFKEVGTRLAKVFLKLAFGLCIYYDKAEIDDEVLQLLREVCVDTCPSIILNLVMKIYQECSDSPSGDCSISRMDKFLNVSKSTVFRIAGDLELQCIIEKSGGEERVASRYKLTSEITDLIHQSELFKENPKNKFFWHGGKKATGD